MKKFLYHCSYIDHGKELTVGRKFPKFPSKEEPNTPRLCTCPTIPQCFSARLFLSSVWVYRTKKPCRGVTPKNVWDELVTDERWLLPGQKLELVIEISKTRIISTFSDIAEWHHRNNRSANLSMRVATLWLACVGFPEHTPPRLMRLADRMCDSLRIDPIEIFLT